MDNAIINMNLTPREALIIENIRDMASQETSTATQHKTQVQIGQELMDKYMAMDDYDFIHKYAEAVGDDTILAVLQDTMTAHEKWDAIWYQTDEDVINDLFGAYVSFEDRRQMFLDSQDREQLCVQLVNALHPSCNF